MTTALRNTIVLNEMIERFGAVRATESSQPAHKAHHAPKWGYDGVDYTRGKFRARISFENALTGEFTRVTLIRTDNVDEAGEAYIAAHIALWGSASRYADDEIVDYLRSVGR